MQRTNKLPLFLSSDLTDIKKSPNTVANYDNMRKVFENVLDYNDFKIKVKQEIRKGETNN